MTQLSFSQISFLTFQAVVQVIIVCFAGFWAAKTGLLNKNAQKIVSVLNVDLFTPALIFSKLAKSLSLKKLLEIIVIPIFYAISTGISYIVSLIVSKFFKFDEYESNFVIAMSVFGNSNSLPVSLTVALSYTLPNLEWSDVDNDSPDQIAARGILYLLIFQQIGQVLRWSWGYNTLLKRKPTPLNSYTVDVEDRSQRFPTPGSSDSDYSKSSPADHLLSIEPNYDESIERANYNDYYEETSLLKKTWFKLSQFWSNFLSFMNPPLYSMIASVIVASIQPIQKALFIDDGFWHNTIAEAIIQLGSVSIPLILIVLGSNLYPSSDIPPASQNYKKIVFASLISRMIIPPIILLPIIAIVVKFLQISIIDDPIFLVVAFILTISPPAIQLSQICQLNEIFEQEMAGVLFWGYVVLTLPTTIVTVSCALRVLEWAVPS
ncbi:putative transporter [Wickerhamomyces ciferrii]|uniref:Transporter n=1 Tax=Wickerhamomyces ciferrii (strain ATCC 14091 / BCRC 22168 / CBS 111 / JCM 3599 / NBRC 0793 / NRRL Y-1031 F-60-10) TaxID=1206466 RepID=K0KKM1_WICCF|nr:putative transporter [Wickerhamomyces ciferrii]CCH45740.1 putative transporter [Wickerhamomyces ciferrii]